MDSSAWKRRKTGGAAVVACFMLPTLGLAVCEGGPHLVATRTFELQYLDPGEAIQMVSPYVYAEREGAPGLVTGFTGGITVRETPEALDRIAEVLEQYDRAKPGVRLRFQIIEADGFTERDARIADVQSALEELFRFEGYRLLTETPLALMEGASSSQILAVDDRQFQIEAHLEQVRGTGARGSVELVVGLAEFGDGYGPSINTTMAVPVGQTVVLGSAKARDKATLILTVLPEFVHLPDGTDR